MKKCLCIAVLLLFGCNIFKRKRDSNDDIKPTVDPNAHVVLVIDSGIDPNHDSYKDKVLGAFTLVCGSEEKTDKSDNKPHTLEETKREFIEELKNSESVLVDSKCEIREGIKTSLPELPSDILSLREKWNGFLKMGLEEINRREISESDEEELNKVLVFLQKDLANYHGTNVTAAIAYKNPNVKFVLVEKAIGLQEKVPTCSELEDSLQYVGIYEDKEVQDLLIEKGRLSEADSIDRLARQFKVTLVNKSYGSNKWIIKQNLEKLGCSHLVDKLAKYATTMSEIDEKIAKRQGIFYDQEPFLTFQAAGNESKPINSKVDSMDCNDGRHHVSVGSYDLKTEKRSDFSNYGDCVDLYGLGTSVITSNPHNFLAIVNGTSFSSPLMVRYTSIEFSHSLAASEIRKEIEKRLDHKKFLPPSKHFGHAAYEAKEGQLHLTGRKNIGKFIIRDNPKLDPSALIVHLPGISH